MKKVLSLMLVFVFVVGICASAPMTIKANAASVDCLTFKLGDDGQSYFVSDCTYEAEGEIIIPSVYNGLPVTKIGDEAFFNTPHITAIQVPDTVLIIGEYAFSHCGEVESITGLEQVTSIGKGAFYGCSELKEAIFPENLTSVGEYVFAFCTAIESVTIPEYVTVIDETAFYNCTKLKTVKLHNDIVSLGRAAFANCTSLVDINLPENLSEISEELFSCCTSLETIEIPDTVNYIGDSAFGNCISLETIVIPEGVKLIEGYTFSRCEKLSSVVLPEGLTKISQYAFYECGELKEINIPSTLTQIGKEAFYNCCFFEKVHIEDLGKWCTIDFYSVDSNPLNYGARLYKEDKLISDLVIPEGITAINKYAFYSECFMDSIQLPKTLKYIGTDAFGGTNIEKVFISDFSVWCNIVFESTPMNSLSKLYLNNEVISGAFIVPDDVSKIPAYTFKNSDLTSVVMPEGVTEIGDEAFGGCKLDSVVIPDSVEIIGKRAFEYCNSLKDVTIGKGVKTIGISAFDYCNALENVYITDLSNWCSIEFKSYKDVFGNDIISSNPTHYGENLYLNGEKVEALVVPEEVTEIKDYAFVACDSLTSVFIPSGVKSIGYKAFVSCSNLEKVAMGDSVTSIGDSAFSDCGKLSSVLLGNNVETIGEYAFLGRTDALKSIGIPESVKVIGDKAFGFIKKNKQELLEIAGFTIYGVKGSAAESYANENGFTFVEVETIKPHDHTYTESITKQPTSIADGVKTYTCSICGDSYTEAIPKLAPPTITKIESTKDGVRFYWDVVDGVEGYMVFKLIDGVYKNIAILNPATRTFLDVDVVDGEGYCYAVASMDYIGNAGTYSETSITYKKLTELATPSVKITNTSKGIKASWNAIENAESYIVYRRVYNASTKKWSGWKKLKSGVTSTSYTDKTVKLGTNYRYTVRAVKGSVVSEYKTTSTLKYNVTPTVKVANASNGIKVSWSTAANATGYTVYSSTYNTKTKKWSGWTNRGTTKSTTTSWVDKKVKSGVKYKYTVRACNGKFKSNYEASANLLYLAQPKTTVKAVSNGINVAWTQSAGATGYTVYRMEYNAKTKKWSGWKNMGTAKSNKKAWTDKSAKKGVTYRYTVRAVNGKVKSSYATSGSVKR